MKIPAALPVAAAAPFPGLAEAGVAVTLGLLTFQGLSWCSLFVSYETRLHKMFIHFVLSFFFFFLFFFFFPFLISSLGSIFVNSHNSLKGPQPLLFGVKVCVIS